LRVNSFEIGVSFNYLRLDNTINFNEDITQQTTENDVLLSDGFVYDRISTINQTNKNIGAINENEIHTNIIITRFFDKFKIGVFGGVSNKKTTTNTVSSIDGIENIVLIFEGNEVLNEDFSYQEENNIKLDSTSVKYNYGVNFDVNLTKKLGVGLEVNAIKFKEQNEFNFNLSTTYKLNDKFNFQLDYIQKGKLEYYFTNNAYLINNLEETKRLSFVTNYNITKKIGLYFVYQRDIIEDSILNKKLNSNTLIAGLKFKL
jgi:hypothetical protein